MVQILARHLPQRGDRDAHESPRRGAQGHVVLQLDAEAHRFGDILLHLELKPHLPNAPLAPEMVAVRILAGLVQRRVGRGSVQRQNAPGAIVVLELVGLRRIALEQARRGDERPLQDGVSRRDSRIARGARGARGVELPARRPRLCRRRCARRRVGIVVDGLGVCGLAGRQQQQARCGQHRRGCSEGPGPQPQRNRPRVRR
mmetsp:Transcript_50155/g.152553  ORF Transcript_50155/g.152553 Transcript_50155/m.152553 type:complete len:201 (+) Transcript_50155:611-1213(+)